MQLTEEQKEFLKPAMEEYEHYLISTTLHVKHRARIDEVRRQNNEIVKYCKTCGGDNINYYKTMYQIYKNG